MACCTSNVYLPAKATAGLSFSALVRIPDYPAPEWALVAYVRGPKSIDLSATPAGDAHQFDATATDTATWDAGEYWYSLRATRGDDVVEVERGTLLVLPDLAQAGAGYDGRSKWRIALDAIDAVLEKRASMDQQRYRINNRELYRMSPKELLALRAFYASKVNQENARKSGRSGFGRQIPVRFS